MAEALRRVSQNYKWTIKRAGNDLHNVITPRPLTPLTSYAATKLTEFPPDSNRIRWKFRTDYEELHEHFERSYLIILSWMVTLDCLLRAAMRHFVGDPIGSVRHLCEECIKPANLSIFCMTFLSLLVSLFRSPTSHLVSLLWGIFIGFSDVVTHAIDKTVARSAARPTGKPVLTRVPVKDLHVLGGTQASARDSTGNVNKADPTILQLAAYLGDKGPSCHEYAK